jgi:hypothetical protein
MDNKRLSDARAHAQEAQSAARLISDPDMKRQWERLAAAWLERVEELQDGQGADKPIIPPLDAGSGPH